jgi:ring-1,2-phenylacetyl-CoA epoxidase subunit PaaC
MTTAAQQRYDSAAALAPDVRAALRDLLLACADSKLLLGYHYGEWTFGTPALEAAVANCSIAQSELGHVRLLHGILKTNWDEDPDRLVEARPAADFANIRYLDADLPDWPSVVAMNFVVDHAVTRVIHALRDSTFTPLRSCAEKLLQEERYHIHHGQGWFRALAGGEAAGRDAVRAAVERAVATVVEWFGPDAVPTDALLVAAGVKATSDSDLRRALLADVTQAAERHGLAIHAPPPPAARAWDPSRRRAGSGAPSDDVLYHLRGTKNEVFKRA